MAEAKDETLMECKVRLFRRPDGELRWWAEVVHSGEVVYYQRTRAADEIVPHLSVLMRQAEQSATAADEAYGPREAT